jgi:hypothetical protein
MSGRYNRTILPGLSAGGAVLTSQADVANTNACSFSTVCSSVNYGPDIRAVETAQRPSLSVFLLVLLKLVTPSSPWAYFLLHLTAAATRPMAPIVSISKCSQTFHSQARSFCYPHTTAYGRRAWCQMPGKNLSSSLFWKLLGIARRQLVTDRSASLVACVRQWSVWWTVVSSGSWRAESFSSEPSACFGAIDLLSTTRWTWNTTYKTRYCYGNISSLSSLTWRKPRTPYGILVILHRWSVFSHPAWVCCLCAFSPRKWSSSRIGFLAWACLQSPTVWRTQLDRLLLRRMWTTSASATVRGPYSPWNGGFSALWTVCLSVLGRMAWRSPPT